MALTYEPLSFLIFNEASHSFSPFLYSHLFWQKQDIIFLFPVLGLWNGNQLMYSSYSAQDKVLCLQLELENLLYSLELYQAKLLSGCNGIWL